MDWTQYASSGSGLCQGPCGAELSTEKLTARMPVAQLLQAMAAAPAAEVAQARHAAFGWIWEIAPTHSAKQLAVRINDESLE